MAPGVTTMAMTRKAPTVCSAATVEADKQREEQHLQAGRVEADRAGVGLVEEDDHQVLPLHQQDRQRHAADDGELQRVLRA